MTYILYKYDSNTDTYVARVASEQRWLDSWEHYINRIIDMGY